MDDGKPGEIGDGARKRARLIDVARRANVSRATAARALGNYGLVTKETRAKVLAAAEALNYRVNELARSMRSGRTLTIGVVVADISNSFFSTSIRAIIDTAASSDYQILVLNTGDDLEAERDAIRVLLEKRVDGMVVVPSSRSHFSHLQLEDGGPSVPIVLLDRYVEGLKISSVTTDDFAASREAVRHFVACGHRRIGLMVATAAVNGHSTKEPADIVWTAQARMHGGMVGLAEAGITPTHKWLRYSRGEFEHARAAAMTILKDEPRPTAILATNEEMAIGCISVANEIDLSIDLSIGRDLSLILFDDPPWVSVFTPPLTVIRRPTYDLGRLAMQLLLAEINGEGTYQAAMLRTEIVHRQSVLTLRATEVDRH
ncbi:LacI family transcriptional regulator [uncultured Pleomorphomonas sp.]|uniref:LacI family transcriptional regulator n=1 Tax=uncultured Pleomorphomonas sp. TaxID=442121 RepID=A0A212LLF6_9HYPH|nr:LacI family DNA-binding transcriptional regulator [uncultured Pleomorphomonas sp.]SCM78350.1 LacI family transcriptional regulator [uncultured Pleomorphomonas sp.]